MTNRSTPKPIGPAPDINDMAYQEPVAISLTKEEEATMRQMRTDGPVVYATVKVADSLIDKGLAQIASVDPEPGEGHKAIAPTVAGNSWALTVE